MTLNTGPLLIVEDIDSVREMFEMQLKLRGYEVMAARDGEEAIALIGKTTPSAILTDILMPRLDGFALAHKLRSNPATSHIPIIFLSATYVSQEDENFAMRLGALRFLPKPTEPDDLVAAVADAVTGQPVTARPLTDEEFYLGYRERLENKLQQKARQIARNQQQLMGLPEEQRHTYRKLIAEAQAEYDEVRRELDVLTKLLNEE